MILTTSDWTATHQIEVELFGCGKIVNNPRASGFISCFLLFLEHRRHGFQDFLNSVPLFCCSVPGVDRGRRFVTSSSIGLIVKETAKLKTESEEHLMNAARTGNLWALADVLPSLFYILLFFKVTIHGCYSSSSVVPCAKFVHIEGSPICQLCPFRCRLAACNIISRCFINESYHSTKTLITIATGSHTQI